MQAPRANAISGEVLNGSLARKNWAKRAAFFLRRYLKETDARQYSEAMVLNAVANAEIQIASAFYTDVALN